MVEERAYSIRCEAMTVLSEDPAPLTGSAAAGAGAPSASCSAEGCQNAAMRASSSRRTIAALFTCP